MQKKEVSSPTIVFDQESFEKERWKDLDFLLNRKGPFCAEGFTEGEMTKNFLQNVCKVLVIGAGGLGCDLLKNLALSGFKSIDVIDMDTIDESNLNRQFLFRDKDVKESKAITAANFINKRVPGCKVTPHYCRIEEKDEEFYKQFHIIICGLDSVVARSWMNKMYFNLVRFLDKEEKEVDMSTVKPLIDGGTEGFKGQARVILPRITACYECTMDMFTEDQNYPLCTIKTKPRLPEHCVQYAYLVEWDKVKNKPGIKAEETPDGDNPKHLKWIYEKAVERSKQFNIRGVTYRLAQGVVKRIIPVFAATNAIVASMCTNEALKLATLMAERMDDYCVYNGNEGIYTYTYKNEIRSNCALCGIKHKRLVVSQKKTLRELIKMIEDDPDIKIKDASVYFNYGDTLYSNKIKILEDTTKQNLDKTLEELIYHDDILMFRDNIENKYMITIRYSEIEEKEKMEKDNMEIENDQEVVENMDEN